MTGIYVRVMRDGRFQAVELDDLSPEEWTAFVAAQRPEDGWVWARALVLWIRDTAAEEG